MNTPMTTHRHILKDGLLDARLRRDGYVTVPFLDAAGIKSLTDVFDGIDRGGIDHFYATAHATDLTFRKNMSEAIRDAFARSVDSYFIDCKPLGGSFVVKPPGEKHLLQPHQDWNIVDETRFRSFNIWVPLVDLDENNGAILVMPGSHLWVGGYRHAGIPCAYGQIHPLLLEHMPALHLKAGEALIYDHAMLHASHANHSDGFRIACACGIIPEEAGMRFYWNNAGMVEEYESSPEFFMTENVFTGPHGLKKIRDIDFDFPQVDEDSFYSLSKIERPAKPEEPAPVAAETSAGPAALPFWKVYTPMNILREIKFRVGGR